MTPEQRQEIWHDGVCGSMDVLTPEQRRELIERPFPRVTWASARHAGCGTTRWTNNTGAVAAQSRNYAGTAFYINGVLYGEDFRRW